MRRTCAPAAIPFETTAEAAPLAGPEVVGQERAVEALEFGVGIRQDGYNLFAMGPPGVGKQTLLQSLIRKRADDEPTPSDWCYMHNFSDSRCPTILRLPAGMGVEFQRSMDGAVADLSVTIRSTFQSEEYRTRRTQLITAFQDKQQRAIADVRDRAEKRDVAVIDSDAGIVLAAIHEGEVLETNKFRKLPEDRKYELQTALDEIGEELSTLLRKFLEEERTHLKELGALDLTMARTATRNVLAPLRSRFEKYPAIIEHIAHVETDAVDNARRFLESKSDGDESALEQALRGQGREGEPFPHYRVNVFVDRSNARGAPVVYEDNPTYANLVGRIEHETQFGNLTTNFRLIRAGSLHRANGGYLILDALKVVSHPASWEALKRTIRSRVIKIESASQALDVAPTVSLVPEPVAFDGKIVLVGERVLYYLLSAHDPDFLELFKVLVDFESSMDRSDEADKLYARLVADLVHKEGLRAFDRGGVARVIDHASRLAGDSEKLTTHMRPIADLLAESDHWAERSGRDIVTANDVQNAIDARRRRSGRVRESIQEAILRGDVRVATDGRSVGQVNGLSVAVLGEESFGHPLRITSRVHLGKGEVLDIEREVDLGGPIHSKGVLILGAYLGSRYAKRIPLSLSASLVFEQSYGMVDGDSASLAELCALLSAIGEIPVLQSFALTGSVDQHGQVQSIGGVNAKIEGFFDICKERGLAGTEGVLIPESNVKNLMLRPDVVEAVGAGQFHIHAVSTVDEAMELLTEIAPGEPDGSGEFPAGSINAKVAARLEDFAHMARSFASGGGEAGGAAKPQA